jgi:hypothetical protein
MFGPAEKMSVIRHDHIPANGPTVAIVRRPPFIDQDFSNLWPSEDGAAFVRARRHKVDWEINPDPLEPAQVSVGGHARHCSWGR